MPQTERQYIPAAGVDWLLPFYDWSLRIIGAEGVKRDLVNQAAIEEGHRVLDVGCGTGTFAVMVKRIYPNAEVVGMDPDLKALARAKRKSNAADLSVEWNQGLAQEMPYPDGSFDRVFSSYMFHHLTLDVKQAMLREVLRLLKPGGSLHLLDFTPSPKRFDGKLARLFHSNEILRDNVEGRIPELMREAGFAAPKEIAHAKTWFGRVGYYRAVHAGSA